MQELRVDANDDDAEPMTNESDAELIQMNQDLAAVHRDQAALQERFKKINIVND